MSKRIKGKQILYPMKDKDTLAYIEYLRKRYPSAGTKEPKVKE